MKYFSKIISYLFHPIFMPTIGVALIFYSKIYLSFITPQTQIVILSLIASCTIMLPLLVLALLHIQKKITNITIPSRKERLLPMFVTMVFYYFTYYILKKYNAPFFVRQFILVSFVSLLLTFILNLKWKISMHMVGIGGVLGLWSSISILFYVFDKEWVLLLIILISGFIGTSRLIIKAHNQTQIYVGFLVGYITSFAILIILNLQ